MAGWNQNLGSPGSGSGSDPTSFTGSGGQFSPTDSLAFENVSPGQNSQTQFMRSLGNTSGQQGQEEYNQGQGVEKGGWDQLAAVFDYLNRLTGGDRSEMMSAIKPETDAVTQQFGQIRRQISDSARGGGKTSTLAQLPSQETSIIGNLLNNARTQAFQQKSNLGEFETQAGIQKQGMGMQNLLSTLANLLGIRGQDLQERGQNLGLLNTFFGSGSVGSDAISKGIKYLMP